MILSIFIPIKEIRKCGLMAFGAKSLTHHLAELPVMAHLPTLEGYFK